MKNVKSCIVFNGVNVTLEGSPKDIVAIIKQMAPQQPKATPKLTQTVKSVAKVGKRKHTPWSDKDVLRVASLIEKRGPGTRGLGQATVKMLKEVGPVQRTNAGVHVFSKKLHGYIHNGRTIGISGHILDTLRTNHVGQVESAKKSSFLTMPPEEA